MILKNYWWLLIWCFVGGFVFNNFFPKKQEIVSGKKVERWSVPMALALVIPYIVAAAFRTDAMVGDSPLSSMGQKNMRGEWH